MKYILIAAMLIAAGASHAQMLYTGNQASQPFSWEQSSGASDNRFCSYLVYPGHHSCHSHYHCHSWGSHYGYSHSDENAITLAGDIFFLAGAIFVIYGACQLTGASPGGSTQATENMGIGAAGMGAGGLLIALGSKYDKKHPHHYY